MWKKPFLHPLSKLVLTFLMGLCICMVVWTCDSGELWVFVTAFPVFSLIWVKSIFNSVSIIPAWESWLSCVLKNHPLTRNKSFCWWITKQRTWWKRKGVTGELKRVDIYQLVKWLQHLYIFVSVHAAYMSVLATSQYLHDAYLE